jgi:putative oxidoreductase
MSNLNFLTELYKLIESITGNVLLVHYTAPAHFLGGILIIFGLLIRWAILAQLPILIGAVSINFVGEMNTTNFLLSSSVLLVCIFFLFYGSGKHSVDKYLKMQQ